MATMSADIIFNQIDVWIKENQTITPNSYNELQKYVRYLYNNNSLSFEQKQKQELTTFFENNKSIISKKLCDIRLQQLNIHNTKI